MQKSAHLYEYTHTPQTSIPCLGACYIEFYSNILKIVYLFDKVEDIIGKKIGKRVIFICNYQRLRYIVALVFEHMFMHEIMIPMHECASFQ